MVDNNGTELFLKLDARLDDIAERVSKIEGKVSDNADKSFRKKISESGGLIALFLSIVIGS
jgi:hypothetical protein